MYMLYLAEMDPVSLIKVAKLLPPNFFVDSLWPIDKILPNKLSKNESISLYTKLRLG